MKELVDAGLVVDRSVKTGEKQTLLELTDRGRNYVETQIDVDMKRRGRGGIVNQYWQHRIKTMIEEPDLPTARSSFDIRTDWVTTTDTPYTVVRIHTPWFLPSKKSNFSRGHATAWV
jgi:hypothetical protein